MIQRKGKISCVQGLEELILLKYPYYPKQSTDSVHPYQNTHDISNRTGTNNPNIYMEPQKTQNSQSNLEKEKMELEELSSLISDYTTKLQ